MKLSIIIPMYNARDFIGGCLESLSNIGLPMSDFEAVIVNDGSQDDGGDVVRSYIGGDLQIQYIEQENGGPGVARNTGIKVATGDYIFYLDSDDFVFEGSLGKAVAAAEGLGLDVLEFRRVAGPEEKLKAYKASSGESVTEVVDGYRYLCEDVSGFVTAYLYSRDFLMEHGIIFEDIFGTEDICYTRAALVRAKRVACMPELEVYAYVDREDSIVHKGGHRKYRRYADGMFKTSTCLRNMLSEYPDLPPVALDLLKRRVDNYVFFLLIRAWRFYPLKYARETYTKFMDAGFLPVGRLLKYWTEGFKWEVLKYIVNHRALFFLTMPLARCFGKYQFKL